MSVGGCKGASNNFLTRFVPSARKGPGMRRVMIYSQESMKAIRRGSAAKRTSVRDDTRGMTQSGIVELRIPARWRPGTPV